VCLARGLGVFWEPVSVLTCLFSSHSEMSEGQGESSTGEDVLGFGGERFGVVVESFFFLRGLLGGVIPRIDAFSKSTMEPGIPQKR
jgi:hypothetical protein